MKHWKKKSFLRFFLLIVCYIFSRQVMCLVLTRWFAVAGFASGGLVVLCAAEVLAVLVMEQKV
jgi:pheromone shutdown protein TraB